MSGMSDWSITSGDDCSGSAAAVGMASEASSDVAGAGAIGGNKTCTKDTEINSCKCIYHHVLCNLLGWHPVHIFPHNTLLTPVCSGDNSQGLQVVDLTCTLVHTCPTGV